MILIYDTINHLFFEGMSMRVFFDAQLIRLTLAPFCTVLLLAWLLG